MKKLLIALMVLVALAALTHEFSIERSEKSPKSKRQADEGAEEEPQPVSESDSDSTGDADGSTSELEGDAPVESNAEEAAANEEGVDEPNPAEGEATTPAGEEETTTEPTTEETSTDGNQVEAEKTPVESGDGGQEATNEETAETTDKPAEEETTTAVEETTTEPPEEETTSSSAPEDGGEAEGGEKEGETHPDVSVPAATEPLETTTESTTTTTTTTTTSTQPPIYRPASNKPAHQEDDEQSLTANCPGLNCPFGYKTDLFGKPICSCFNPCYEKRCGSDICKIEKFENRYVGACYDPNKIAKERPLHCHAPLATGNCRNYSSRYYYNSFKGKCFHFIYTGCNGNDNNFPTWEKCEMECNVCSLPVAKGPCHGHIIRWYFDSVTKECTAFNWGGCKGNENNFATRKHCEESCLFRKEGALFLNGMPMREIRIYHKDSRGRGN